jgi:hypothetical protein
MVMFIIKCLTMFVKWFWLIIDEFWWKFNNLKSEFCDENDENEFVIGGIVCWIGKDDYVWKNQG